ncbi:MAG: Cocaine esterase [Chloroflexi bacterium ADurb.Bin325]|nr:MAG: Cocaine esterase [Chloroflexi bacterium ADurb.Bin325]
MQPRSLIVERDVPVVMRDGVTLRADVYRPTTDERLPVLLQRTPYGKNFSNAALGLLAAERGYVAVFQDTRGRWNSEGADIPFVHEKADGHDTVNWAAGQPWSNGKVGMFGGSYLGYTQIASAVTHPPALKAIVPHMAMCDLYDVTFVGGAVGLGLGVSWGLGSLAPMAILRQEPAAQPALMEQLVAAIDGMARGETFRRTPLVDMPLIGRQGLVPWFSDLLGYPRDHEFWRSQACAPADITIPALHVGGWYDVFAAHTVRDFAAVRAAGNTQQKLLMGPWYHGPMDGWVGEVDFGMAASGGAIMFDEIQLRWFDHWLKGNENGIMEEPAVRLFVMGRNRWRTEDAWPLARARDTAYYLHSGGAANTLHGDGMLSTEPPGDEAADTYLYDPRNPVPTRGGGLCCSSAALTAGAFDQRAIEARPDVLVYTTPILQEDVEVTGVIRLHLWAATNAPDTDFTAKLVDVGPCGFARNLCDGILRGRHMAGGRLEPGRAYEWVIELGPTSNVFLAGHRIRLEVASSNFPRYDRNLNTGESIGEGTAMRSALQTVLHDSAHASRLILPIVPDA